MWYNAIKFTKRFVKFEIETQIKEGNKASLIILALLVWVSWKYMAVHFWIFSKKYEAAQMKNAHNFLLSR
jgi:flagellar basal body-associated protein FliL